MFIPQGDCFFFFFLALLHREVRGQLELQNSILELVKHQCVAQGHWMLWMGCYRLTIM